MKILQSLGDDIVKDMVKIIELNGSIATGNLIKSMASKVSMSREGQYQLSFSYLKYGKWVDEGRRPGKMPPVGDIRDWCRIKGIPQSAAFPIAKKIGERGFRGIDFTQPIGRDLKVIKEILGEKFSSVFAKQLLKTENLDLLKIK